MSSRGRLRQVDLDGSFSFSTIELVSFLGTSAGFSLYPNPARQQLTIEAEAGPARIRDLFGRLLKTIELNPDGPTVIDIQDLSFGTYWVELAGQRERQRLIIQ